MIPVNYHHLYYFWVTAKSGSINAAKDKLLLAQPTLSLQIRLLENSLGKKLLHRSRSGVSLTPDGRIALEYCERIFSQGDALLAALRGGGQPNATLQIGVAKSISRAITLEILDFIRESKVEARAAIFTGTAAELQERLKRHTLDLAVCDMDLTPALGKDFRGKLAGAIPIYFVAAPFLKKKLGRFPATGAEVPMLFRAPENPIRRQAEQYLVRHRLRFVPAAETEDSDLIRILAIQGKGVAAMDALSVREDLAQKRLVRLNSAPSGITEYVWLLASAHANPNPVLRPALEGLMSDFSIRGLIQRGL